MVNVPYTDQQTAKAYNVRSRSRNSSTTLSTWRWELLFLHSRQSTRDSCAEQSARMTRRE